MVCAHSGAEIDTAGNSFFVAFASAPEAVAAAADATRALAEHAKAALGEEAWAVAFAPGRALTLEEAVAEVLSDAN